MCTEHASPEAAHGHTIRSVSTAERHASQKSIMLMRQCTAFTAIEGGRRSEVDAGGADVAGVAANAAAYSTRRRSPCTSPLMTRRSLRHTTRSERSEQN
eukprot:3308453-Pleurochrysis_carterae.AAC.1